jgi:predicted RecB family nuclease
VGYIPIRFVPSEKLSRHNKLLLAFDALTLGEAFGNTPLFGKIIHGAQHRITKIPLATLLVTVRSVITKILSQAETHQPPQLILNKHCAECGFNPRCRHIAEEKGDLSLLSRMSKLEREKFWANDERDERENWAALVARLAAWSDSRLIYYGSYESTFLKRMIQRYPEVAEDFPHLDRFMSEAVNVLRLISTQIYFLT